jgi:hypothetical protein
MLSDQRLQLAEQHVVPAGGELGFAEQLECMEALFLEAVALRECERLGREVGKRGPAPEREPLAQGGGSGVEIPPGAGDQRPEALEVDLARLEHDPVARAVCLDPVGAERLPEPGDVDLE